MWTFFYVLAIFFIIMCHLKVFVNPQYAESDIRRIKKMLKLNKKLNGTDFFQCFSDFLYNVWLVIGLFDSQWYFFAAILLLNLVTAYVIHYRQQAKLWLLVNSVLAVVLIGAAEFVYLKTIQIL